MLCAVQAGNSVWSCVGWQVLPTSVAEKDTTPNLLLYCFTLGIALLSHVLTKLHPEQNIIYNEGFGVQQVSLLYTLVLSTAAASI